MAEESEEDLSNKIKALGDAIKEAKAAKKPKEEWESILKDMLALKEKYKAVTGKAFGPPPKEDKKKKPANQSDQGPSEKNKEKRAAKAAAKAAKEAKKAAARAEREAREKAKADRLAGIGQDNFGDAPMVQSDNNVSNKMWTEISQLQPVLSGQTVLVRGHLQTARKVGKGAFCLVRSTIHSVQGVAFEDANKGVSKAMLNYIAGLATESVVDMEGVVTIPDQPIDAATQNNVEIAITSFHCVSKTCATLPFQMEDACRPDTVKESDVGAYNEDEQEQEVDAEGRVSQKMRLDSRCLDLRTPANQSIVRIQSMIGCLFRECLMKKGFVEIHTPKLLGGVSESGADAFTLDYFGRPACLAQSPQLHKQMAAACSGLNRVFETGPVFRAENSNTRRHLCEFTGFDMEMVRRSLNFFVIESVTAALVTSHSHLFIFVR